MCAAQYISLAELDEQVLSRQFTVWHRRWQAWGVLPQQESDIKAKFTTVRHCPQELCAQGRDLPGPRGAALHLQEVLAHLPRRRWAQGGPLHDKVHQAK